MIFWNTHRLVPSPVVIRELPLAADARRCRQSQPKTLDRVCATPQKRGGRILEAREVMDTRRTWTRDIWTHRASQRLK